MPLASLMTNILISTVKLKHPYFNIHILMQSGVHIPGISSFRVHDRDEVTNLLQKGLKNRAIRATDFNAESSRSHTILQVCISIRFRGLYLHTGGVLFHLEWCTRQLWCSFVISLNITSIAYNNHTDIYPLLNI